MKRTHTFAITLTALIASLALPSCGAQEPAAVAQTDQAATADPQTQDKPNVVFMLADNVGYGDIGGAIQGGVIRGMPTPRINQLQSEIQTISTNKK